MAFEVPPAEGRQCISCGDIKPLNFFGLDQQECRNCGAQRRHQSMKQDADDAAEASRIKLSINKHMHQCSLDSDELSHGQS